MQGYLFSGGVLVALGVACSVDVDLTGRPCPCAAGYVCDDARKICVRPGEQTVTPIPTPIPACDPCPCTTDGDCKDPTRPACSLESKTCVECVPGASDRCVGSQYCNAKFQCTPGCKTSKDCEISPSAKLCAVERHQCVTCLTTNDCTAGKTCSPSGACVESCGTSTPCTGGQECCDGLCTDLKEDVFACGACNKTCSISNGTPRCEASACTWRCADGFAHCGTGNTGCETETRKDPAHCGSCDNSCATLQHVTGAACSSGKCVFTKCEAGWGDLDGNPANGCEEACGMKKNDRCCPGNVCAPGHACNTASGKCT